MDSVRRALVRSGLILPAAAATWGSAQAATPPANLPWVSIASFGASPAAGAERNTAAFRAAFRAALASGPSRNLHRPVYVPAGVYKLNAIEIGMGTNNPNAWHVFGDGKGSSILEFQHRDGDAVTIGGRGVELSDLTITASSERRSAGNGNGIVTRLQRGRATQGRIRLLNVKINGQPGDGIFAYDPELHHYENTWAANNAGAGIHWIGHRGGPSNCILQCRAIKNGEEGIRIDGRIAISMLLMTQCLRNSGTQIAVNGGRSIHLVEPDIEATALVREGKSVTGLRLRGITHRVIGGSFFGLTVGIELRSAKACLIDMPHFSNPRGAEDMAYGVLEDRGSTENRIILSTTYNRVRTVHHKDMPL